MEKNGEVKVVLTYSKAGDDKIIIDHTEVSDEPRGENIGKQLVEHTVSYARKSELTMIPLWSVCQVGYRAG